MKISIGRIGDNGMDAIMDTEQLYERMYDEKVRREYIKDHFYHGTKRLKGVILKTSKVK